VTTDFIASALLEITAVIDCHSSRTNGLYLIQNIKEIALTETLEGGNDTTKIRENVLRKRIFFNRSYFLYIGKEKNLI
jgi:hypothetical protein